MKTIERVRLARSKAMGLSLLNITKKKVNATKDEARVNFMQWLEKEYVSEEWFTWYICAIREATGQ